jgi:hypothetical protein
MLKLLVINPSKAYTDSEVDRLWLAYIYLRWLQNWEGGEPLRESTLLTALWNILRIRMKRL